MIRESLNLIKKSNREIEITIFKFEIDSDVKHFANWRIEEVKEIPENILKNEKSNYEAFKHDKIKNMINILISELEEIVNYTYLGKWYKDGGNNFKRTIIFEKDFNYWENILIGIWEKFNDMGYSKFIEKYWESYNLNPENIKTYICEYERFYE